MATTLCTGRGDATGSHCCFLHGVECDHLVDNEVPGDGRFRCGLFEELGSWQAVHDDPRYVTIRPFFETSELCGDWQPKAGQCCLEDR